MKDEEKYSSIRDTVKHKYLVAKYLGVFMGELNNRGSTHDYSKAVPPELKIFDEVTPKLKGLTYGSPEYKASLAYMGDALKHHYEVNRHHPEHFADGVRGMNLVDMVEMFCDWFAATKRHADGNIYESIDKNKERFEIGDVLQDIFINTAHWLEYMEKG